jgi:hypothetical protein
MESHSNFVHLQEAAFSFFDSLTAFKAPSKRETPKALIEQTLVKRTPNDYFSRIHYPGCASSIFAAKQDPLVP